MNKFTIRKLIQNIFLGLWVIFILILIPYKFHTCHQFCPYATICFGTMTLNGYFAYIQIVVIGLLIAVSTIFIGRKFCGYICFLGTMQEYLFKLNPQKRKTQLPLTIHRILGVVKYVILIITFIMALFLIQYLYMSFCPVVAISFPNSISFFGIITLIIIFVGGFFIERSWCRYLCPYAALMNIFQFIGKITGIKKHVIKRNWEVCIDCGICTKNCPMNIDISKYEDITDHNCIHCLKCIKFCPKDDCMTC
ncbi:MAG: 4Fe-4S binding protein [Candidatus Cloacimonetes bacterium]|nr:4Fe-4S binding protein [Candidatus Cloacimonadota bacterium]MBL7149580.1 4Fe-4S binding protein [Candidatus Cloacimonadota bacterium]